jgi:hypothetical protein
LARGKAKLASHSGDYFMPLTLLVTEGVLPVGTENIAFARLGEAMIKWHGLTDNAVIKRNVVGSVHVLKKGTSFVGMEVTSLAVIEWKVPAFAFSDPEVQAGYCREATEIVHEISGGTLPRDKVFINVVHAVEGPYNFDGKPMTNAEIGAAIAAG